MEVLSYFPYGTEGYKLFQVLDSRLGLKTHTFSQSNPTIPKPSQLSRQLLLTCNQDAQRKSTPSDKISAKNILQFVKKQFHKLPSSHSGFIGGEDLLLTSSALRTYAHSSHLGFIGVGGGKHSTYIIRFAAAGRFIKPTKTSRNQYRNPVT